MSSRRRRSSTHRDADPDATVLPPQQPGGTPGGRTQVTSRHPPQGSRRSDPRGSGPTTPQHTLHTFTHEYLRGYIAFADQKAAAVFAVGAALLAYLKSEGGMDISPFWHGHASLRGVLGLVATIFFVIACGYAMRVVLPRQGSGKIRFWPHPWRKKGSNPDDMTDGVIYWEQILRHESAEAYAAGVERMTDADVRRQVLLHSYTLASINHAKYADLDRASRIGVAAMALTFAFAFLEKSKDAASDLRTIAKAPVVARCAAPIAVPAPTAGGGVQAGASTGDMEPRRDRQSCQSSHVSRTTSRSDFVEAMTVDPRE